MADSGFTRPDLPNLINNIRSDLMTRLSSDTVLRRLDDEVYARVMAAAVHTLYGYLDYLARNMLPDLADEDWLIRHGNLKSVPRKQPTIAHGFVRWENLTEQVFIVQGTQLQRDDQVAYVTTEDATVNNGVLRAPVVAIISGTAGNCDDGQPLRLITPINGLSSTGHADSIEGGTDLEDLELWRSRIMARWYYLPQSGADPDYIQWATEVAGVTRAWVFRGYSGAGTVGVMVANNDEDNPLPDQTIIDATRSYILPLAPVAGAGLTIFGPNLKTIDMTIALATDTPVIRNAVEKELKAMLMRDGKPGGKLYLSRMIEAVSIASGELAHRIESPDVDITLGQYELPVLGKITWTDYESFTGTIAITMAAFTPTKVKTGGTATTRATVTPWPLPAGATLKWAFDMQNSDTNPGAILTFTPGNDKRDVTIVGHNPGHVMLGLEVTYKNQTVKKYTAMTVDNTP